MNKGRFIYLVTMKTSVLNSSRAFDTEKEALEHVSSSITGLSKPVEVSPGYHLAGVLFEIKPIRLGLYEDES